MDWTDCPLIERLADAYRLPPDAVRRVLAFYDQHEERLAPA